MKTLKLFNAVVARKASKRPFIDMDNGIVIDPAAMWAKDNILAFYEQERLDGKELNKTFHKSFAKVRNTSRFELACEQIRHYMSTYGTNFRGDIYIPNEILEVPELKLSFKAVEALSAEEMTQKCLNLLRSGIALKEETINDILSVLTDELRYVFTGKEGIKNKEAIVKIADLYGIVPQDTMEFFRYIVYRATGESLLIKSKDAIEKIKKSNFNPGPQFERLGLERLAEIFNRFKPLFLAFKNQCPATINRIAKLSKVCHKPLVSNPLNEVTQRKLLPTDDHWLRNATPFALFKAIGAVHNRLGSQTDFVYRIRNGKSWVASDKSCRVGTIAHNFSYLYDYMKNRCDLTGRTIFIPQDVEYALPTSEKMFVGNIPTGTKVYGDRLAVGMYWENSWGARDLDLSGMDITGGKVGWNSRYFDGNSLTYSGDITNAPNGAVEYLHADKNLKNTYLVLVNTFSGQEDCEYKIIVGRGDSVDRNYMMNPNNLLIETKCQAVQKQTILGMLMPAVGNKKQAFVILNFGAGHARVSGRNCEGATRALYQQWSNPLSFNEFVTAMGASVVSTPEDADFDFSLEKLEKDSFTKLFAQS